MLNKMNREVLRILDKAQSDIPLTREDCIKLLNVEEHTVEAGLIRSVASEITRRQSGNSAVLLGQIGVEIDKCPGNCQFCAFGEDHTQFEKRQIPHDELEEKMNDFCRDGDLYALYLLTMHEYDLKFYLETVKAARKIAPQTTQLWANVGDSPLENYQEMKKAGITGIYHVRRIGEGKDTSLEPEDRIQSMRNALDAGLKLYTCCEPIGPEHSVEEIVENMFIGIEMGCSQHAAMRRVAVPGAPMAKYGQITELRLGQIVAVVSMATHTLPTMERMGCHEPNKIGFTSGANIITAESGANPRDTNADTSKNRGLDMAECRKMLYDSGYEYLRIGDESKIPLDLNYLMETKSI